jgi:hypothetical protein
MATFPKSKSNLRDLGLLDRMARHGVDGAVLQKIASKLKLTSEAKSGSKVAHVSSKQAEGAYLIEAGETPVIGMMVTGTPIPSPAVAAVLIGSARKAVAQAKNDRATRLIYIFDLAKEAFGDEKLVQQFMTRKHPILRASPLKKLETEWGGREVEKILNAIIYGLPA